MSISLQSVCRSVSNISVLFVLVLGASTFAFAQTQATVSVNAGSALNTIPTGAVGINTAVWDGDLLDSVVPSLMNSAGIKAMRYPGGSTSDQYAWSTNSIVPGQGSSANPNNGFDAFMAVAKASGVMPIITVNYGSNTAGNGGGTPSYAASWVTYANITKSYGIKYWEVGNEVYGNGEYGSQWETDLHSAHDPTTYGANVAAFASAMKAANSSIKVGAVLAAPGNWPEGQSPDWNSSVLAQCGSSINFVIVHWYPENPGSESDSALLASPQNGIGGSGIPAMVSALKSLIAQYCGSNAPNVQIFITETNSVSSNPGKQTQSIVNAMFVADDVMTWLEGGVANLDIWALHNGSYNGNNSSSLYGSATFGDYGILSDATSGEPSADTPFPTYYGMQMLTHLGQPGDSMVSSSSTNNLLSVHAVKQQNGNLAILLINKDLNNSTTASITLTGYTPASNATVYTYGKTSSSITSSGISNAGSSFSLSVAPYSLTSVVLVPIAQNLLNGIYEIAAATNTANCLDCEGYGTGDGTPIQIYPFKDTANQQWQVINLNNGYYSIKSINPNGSVGRSLDCTNGSPNNGTLLQLWDYWSGPGQMWAINSIGGGSSFSIATSQAQSNGTHDVLDGANCSAATYTPVQLWSWDNGNCQQSWNFISLPPVPNGNYEIAATTTGNCLDCEGYGTTNGTPIQLFGYNGTSNQKWQLTWLNNGYYSIQTINPDGSIGRSLDCTGCSPNNGTQLELWDYWGGSCQQWELCPQANGSYSIVTSQSQANGTKDVLDGTNCSGAVGTKVQLWSWDGGNCQQTWNLVPQ